MSSSAQSNASQSSQRALNQIYSALDSHQYTRAIKLCQGQLAAAAPVPNGAVLVPSPQQLANNALVMALMAHAYAKSAQRYKALLTIQQLWDPHTFPELQLELRCAALSEESVSESSSATPSTTTLHPATAAVPKKGVKKGKKPSAPAPHSASKSSAPTPLLAPWDWIDQLDNIPTIPTDWDHSSRPGTTVVPLSPTLLATLSMTMTVVLKLPLTAYQLYVYAMNATPSHSANTNSNSQSEEKRVYTHQAYLHGLAVLLAPQYTAWHVTLLSQLQGLAVHIARTKDVLATALWPAQTALWQVAHRRQNGDTDTTVDARAAMLPRLAESLALSCVTEFCRRDDSSVHGIGNGTDDAVVTIETHDDSSGSTSGLTLLATESFLLYLRTLEQQEKWTAQVQALDDYSRLLPKQTMADLKLHALAHLPGREVERRDILQDLLQLYPDDWDFWKQYYQASLAQVTDVEAACQMTEAYVATILQMVASTDASTGQGSSEYPLRGPRLMQVELAWCRMIANGNIPGLVQAIVSYGNEFCGRASCIFSDVRPYLQECLQVGAVDHLNVLYEWTRDMTSVVPSSDNAKTRRTQLRVYIFAIQVSFQVLVSYPERWDDDLPSWEVLVQVWKDFQAFERSENVDQAQKESRPADELILLAVQRLLCQQPGTRERMIAVCLLEEAMRNSPYNPYLKICAMFVYGDLHAAARSMELYSDLSVKHIQNETCSYLILPLLRSGGLYRETISVCQDVIVLQRSSGRDVAEYTSRAMENGAVSKAEEFMNFHKNRMVKSLTTLEAKGLILDAAPLLVHDSEGVLGVAHGIVGGDADIDRVKQMVTEAHNPSGAFSLLQISGPVEELAERVSLNRDLSILSYEILVKRELDSPEQILRESVRRGNLHNILIRAALLVDATKGPKKGKATKSSSELDRRSKSLLKSVDNAAHTAESALPREYGLFLQAVIDLCLAMVALSSGLDLAGDAAYETMDLREAAMLSSLQKARDSVQSAVDANASSGLSVSQVSRMLPECIAPLFAIFQMSAKLADLYGWGRRKRKTKRCADAIANFALSFAQLIQIVQSTVSRNLRISEPDAHFPRRLPADVSYVDIGLDTDQVNLIDESLFDATNRIVFEAQDVTRGRIESVLKYVYGTLNGYNIDE